MPIGGKKSSTGQSLPPAEPAREVEAEPKNRKTPKEPKPHYGPIPKQLLADYRLKACAKVVYAFIKMTDATSGGNGKTVAQIAAGIGYSDQKTISKHLAALVVYGYIVYESGGGRAARRDDHAHARGVELADAVHEVHQAPCQRDSTSVPMAMPSRP
jgi:hypothetical protein